jgi:hypothetical protein
VDEASLAPGPLRDALLALAMEHVGVIDRAEATYADRCNRSEGGDAADIRANR